MAKYKLRIFTTAQNDLREMVEYLNTLSAQAATEHYDAVVAGIGSLAETPERCPLVRDMQLRLRGYRALCVKNYLVLYVVGEGTVEIRRILYARRQYEELI